MSTFEDSDSIIELIGCYIDEVARAVELLRKAFKRDDFMYAVNMRMVPRIGSIGADANYRFHGVGCAVTRGGITIDFDFGPDDRHDGFDAWRLHLFARNNPGFELFSELLRAEQGLDMLLGRGLVWAPCWTPSPHLLYLTDKGAAALKEARGQSASIGEQSS